MQEKLQQLYIHYQAGEFAEAKKLLSELQLLDPENPYVVRYTGLLENKGDTLAAGSEASGDIPRIKGKVLLCPKCQSRIPFSAMTSDQRNAIQSGNYNNLTLKCPYCHSEFTLQKKKAASILGLKIGNIGTIEGIKYRVVGYTEYAGGYREYSRGRYTEGGSLRYLEWILLGEDASYTYLSESTSRWDGGSETTFELSKKIIPEGKIEVDIKNLSVTIDGKKEYFKESSQVSVKSLYGENSKSYTLGEGILLYELGGLVYEVEGSMSQKEVGFYKERELSRAELREIFGPEFQISAQALSSDLVNNLTGGGIFVAVLLFIFSPLFLLLIIPVMVGYFIYLKAPEEKRMDLLKGLGASCAMFGVMFLVGILFSTTTQIESFADIEEIGNYKIQFSNTQVAEEYVTKTRSYDYGGIKTSYAKNTGWEFSLHSETDMQILKELQKSPANSSIEVGELQTLTKQTAGSKIEKIEDLLDF